MTSRFSTCYIAPGAYDESRYQPLCGSANIIVQTKNADDGEFCQPLPDEFFCVDPTYQEADGQSLTLDIYLSWPSRNSWVRQSCRTTDCGLPPCSIPEFILLLLRGFTPHRPPNIMGATSAPNRRITTEVRIEHAMIYCLHTVAS